MTSDREISSATILPIFYYSDTFRHLISKGREEIRRRLSEVPSRLRDTELLPAFRTLGEASGEPAWELFHSYLDKIEVNIAAIVAQHTPSFWFHLYRRIRPTLAAVHESKTDDTTVTLVRRIAELSFAKHGNLSRPDDLGLIIHTRLETFLDGAWYEATALALGSKLKAKERYQDIKWTQQVVLSDFHASDLYDVFSVEGLAYEYWWASAVMRSVGKGSAIRYDNERNPPISYKDDTGHPFCFEIYDRRTEERSGFYTRLGTWLDKPSQADESQMRAGQAIYYAALKPNPEFEQHAVWDADERSIRQGSAITNFAMGVFPIAKFAKENAFMAESFKEKHGVDLAAVLFAVWAASFFSVFTGSTSRRRSREDRFARTMANWNNLAHRGYSMSSYRLDQIVDEAIWWSSQLDLPDVPPRKEISRAFDFIQLSTMNQARISLWSGGKKPILIPSLGGFMIDLAAIVPFLHLIFFGLRKVQQTGGRSFEEAVRKALKDRGVEIILEGRLKWPDAEPREVDVAVRKGDKLIVIECFSYELPLDYEVGKPSVFANRKKFIAEKMEQARTLANRISTRPKGSNFDVSWANEVDWRVVSPFVEFAWDIDEPFFDATGLPRILQIDELLENITTGEFPAQSSLSMLKEMRHTPMKGQWH